MAMTRVLLLCLFSLSLLLESTNAASIINNGDIGKGRIPCDFGKCPEQVNIYNNGCGGSRKLKQLVEPEPHDQLLNDVHETKDQIENETENAKEQLENDVQKVKEHAESAAQQTIIDGIDKFIEMCRSAISNAYSAVTGQK